MSTMVGLLSGLALVRWSGHLCLVERWFPCVPACASCPLITAGVFRRFKSIGSRIVERDDQSCLGCECQDQALVEELIDDRKLVSGSRMAMSVNDRAMKAWRLSLLLKYREPTLGSRQ